MRKNKDLFSIFPADAGVNLTSMSIFLHKNLYSPRMRG